MSYIQQVIGANIKKHRKSNGFTLEILAEKIGINYQNLSKIEHGKGFVTADTFEKICEALNITPAQLVTFDNALPEQVNYDDVKPLLHQIINTLDAKKSKALYKVILGFLEAID